MKSEIEAIFEISVWSPILHTIVVLHKVFSKRQVEKGDAFCVRYTLLFVKPASTMFDISQATFTLSNNLGPLFTPGSLLPHSTRCINFHLLLSHYTKRSQIVLEYWLQIDRWIDIKCYLYLRAVAVLWDALCYIRSEVSSFPWKKLHLNSADAIILHHFAEDPAVSLWVGTTPCNALQK